MCKKRIGAVFDKHSGAECLLNASSQMLLIACLPMYLLHTIFLFPSTLREDRPKTSISFQGANFRYVPRQIRVYFYAEEELVFEATCNSTIGRIVRRLGLC